MKFDKLLEKKKNQFIKKNTNSINIKIELKDNDLHLVKDLTYHEIIYLIEHKYKIIYQQNLHGIRDYYLINSPLNESLQHCFLVQIIKQVLKNNFETVIEYRTRKPDIVFKVRNKYVALEIETGKVLSKNKKRLLDKIKSLNENFGDDWFIIVTNRDFISKYRQFGKTVSRKNFLKKVSSHVKSIITFYILQIALLEDIISFH